MTNKLTEKDVVWVVNEYNEVGVLINGQAFFMYKGESIEYKRLLPDSATKLKLRKVGKRECGETYVSPDPEPYNDREWFEIQLEDDFT